MNHFPPPSPHDRRPVDIEPAIAATAPRRRGGTIAALTAGVLIGGLVAGTQFASASTPAPDEEPAPAETTPEPAAESVEDDGEIVELDGAEWEAWNVCFDTQLGIDGDDTDSEAKDLTEEQFVAAEEACIDLMPEEFRIDVEAWDAYETCISEQLGDFGGPDVKFGKGEYHGGVSLDVPSGDDVDFSTYNFGEGDGTIMITKAGDDVSIAVDGDVTKFDHEALETEWQAYDTAWRNAEDVCGDLLPEDALVFDGDLKLFDGELEMFDGAIGELEQLIEEQLVD